MSVTLAQIRTPVSPPRRRGVVLTVLLAQLMMTSVMAADTEAVTPRTSHTLEVYVRDGCPHCADAKAYLVEISARHPGLDVVYRPVDRDDSARAELAKVSAEAGIWPPGVPTFAIDGRVLVGFTDAATTGPRLTALIDDATPSNGEVATTRLGTLRETDLGLPLFTLALGLLDGFNPCAMWVLLFLLSLLVRLGDRRRMAVIAGTFVVVSGAIYYAFMAAWLNLFLILGMTNALRWGIGGVAVAVGIIHVKDFFKPLRGPSLSIPDPAKPGIYARARRVLQADALAGSLVAVAALAVVVNFVELLCTAGIPTVYTAVLAQHALAPAAHYAYLGLYIIGYVADDAVMVTVAVLALSSRKLTARAGRWLKLLSGSVMLVLGAMVLLRPGWLF